VLSTRRRPGPRGERGRSGRVVGATGPTIGHRQTHRRCWRSTWIPHRPRRLRLLRFRLSLGVSARPVASPGPAAGAPSPCARLPQPGRTLPTCRLLFRSSDTSRRRCVSRCAQQRDRGTGRKKVATRSVVHVTRLGRDNDFRPPGQPDARRWRSGHWSPTQRTTTGE